MPNIFCSRCSRPNPDTSRFCSNCGAPLIRGTAGKSATETTSMISLNSAGIGDVDAGEELAIDYAALEALPPDAALLIVTRGPNVGSRFLLDDDFTSAGRHPDSDIFLDDVTVSRRHAEFYRQGARFTVRDVGSLNGTYVNRERIEEAELFGGDEVQIGKFRLRFLTRSPEVGKGRGSGGVQGYA
ncbi:MAG TPA: FHA domain-containing protein [Trebonia sp.]|nr:FHA domain-containing protein [Trebonia sp.]